MLLDTPQRGHCAWHGHPEGEEDQNEGDDNKGDEVAAACVTLLSDGFARVTNATATSKVVGPCTIKCFKMILSKSKID